VVGVIERRLCDAVDVGAKTLDQFEKQLFFAAEVVIQAAPQYAGGCGDVSQRGARACRGDHRFGRLQDPGTCRALAGPTSVRRQAGTTMRW
jgi:hypothetical protein